MLARIAPIILIAVLGVSLRFYNLDLRPFHHDEGVNFHFILEMVQRGFYPYSHENYHGPLFFYGLQLFVSLFGEGESAFRYWPAATGVALLFSPFLVQRAEGRGGWDWRILGALFLALSPSLVFYARYTIHETLFVLCQLVFVFSLARWFERGGRKSLYLSAAALAGLVTTKETFPLSLFCILLGSLAAFGPWHILNRIRNSDLARPYLLFALLVIGTFTGLFRWSSGAREMLRSIPQWVGRGTESDYGHFKPFSYYLEKVLYPTELPLLLLILGGVLLGLYLLCCRRERSFTERLTVIFAVWIPLTLILYSSIPYKTPWLVLNVTAPGAILAALFVQRTIRFHRLLGWGLLSIVLILQLRLTVKYNFRAPSMVEKLLVFQSEPYSDANPFIYVHTTDGMVEIVRAAEEYKRRFPEAKLLVGVNGHWPLPYYLRDFKPAPLYQSTTTPEQFAGEFDIIIAEHAATWESEEFERRYYRLNGAQESFTYFRKR